MAATRKLQPGFTMIEVLIAMLVLTIGLLGLVGLQVVAQRAELESYQRAQAMVLMNDIVDRISSNRKAAACYAITTSATAGTPYVGATGTGVYDTSTYACPSLATNPNAVTRAGLDLQLIEEMMLGASEVTSGNRVGAMIGARACIGFDSASQSYTVAIAWQGLTKTFSPAGWDPTINPAFARRCAYGTGTLYGDDAQRRVLWTTLLIASLT
jgi:type IV pilus assembly protein PilV